MFQDITILLIGSAGALLLLLLLTIARVFTRRNGVTWLQILLLALGMSGFVVAMGVLSLQTSEQVSLRALRRSFATEQFREWIWIAPAVLLLCGLIVIAVEYLRNRSQSQGWRFRQSGGGFVSFASTILALLLLVAPSGARMFQGLSSSIVSAAAPQVTPAQAAATSTATNMLFSMQTNTPALTAFPMAALWPTPLPTQYAPVTPTLSAILPAGITAGDPACRAIVQNNLNLRTGPGISYDILETIPSGTVVSVIAQSSDREWIQVVVEDSAGWMSRTYLRLADSCPELPIVGA
jgi:hypothetical protein